MFGDVVAVGGEELVGELGDLVQVEFGGRVGVEHRSVVYVFASAGLEGFNGECLGADVGADERSELRRELADWLGVSPEPSTVVGTSTMQPWGRLSISPWLGTLV